MEVKQKRFAILLKSNATILGNVFTQGDITFEEGASVGQPQKIRSVIARNKIRFYGKNTVFGFVSAGAGGDVFMDLDSKEDAVINRFPEKQKQIKHLVFQNVEDYTQGHVERKERRFTSCTLNPLFSYQIQRNVHPYGSFF